MDPSEEQLIPKKNWFRMHHVLGWAFLVVVAAAIVGGVYYWQTVSNLPIYQVPATATNPMVGWQTYTNTQYGFQVQVPPDWIWVDYSVKGSDGQDQGWSGFTTAAQDQAERKQIALCQAGDPNAGGCEGTSMFMTFSNVSFLKDPTITNLQTVQLLNNQFSTYVGPDVEVEHYEINNGSKVYDFIPNAAPDTATFKNDVLVLSTLKFTDSTWKTYTDAQNAISFKYPGDWNYKNIDSSVNFFPPGEAQDLSTGYSGDISVSIITNPNKLDLNAFYQSEGQDLDLFKNSEKQNTFTSTKYSGEEFFSVYGEVPSDTIAINKGSVIVEITDIGENHAVDGILDAIASSIQ